MEADDLFSVRNMFWLGNYEAALEEAQQFTPGNDRERIDRDVFIFRCYVSQGNGAKVIAEVGDAGSAATDVLAVKLFAAYSTQAAAQREAVLSTFKDWLSDETSRDNAMLQLMAATAFFREGDTSEALKSLRASNNLEQMALRIQILLSLNRADLALRELQAMQQLDDDSTLTQLSMARVYLASGGAKYQEAAYIYQEQMDKSVSSALLLNGLGAAHMRMKRFDEAEKYLEEARQKAPKDPEVLVNLACCLANTRRAPQRLQQALAQLRQAAPTHPLLAQLDACEAAFDRVAATHKAPAASA